MVNPRFFALTVWEPSIGSADAHVHDKVEFYTDPDRKALNTPLIHGLGRGANPEPLNGL
jgi:hypothetical protein